MCCFSGFYRIFMFHLHNMILLFHNFSTMDVETKTRVIKVINKVTGKEIINLDPDDDLKSQLNLDSIQIVELFASLEAELGVELPLSMMTAKTGGAFMKMLDEQLTRIKP